MAEQSIWQGPANTIRNTGTDTWNFLRTLLEVPPLRLFPGEPYLFDDGMDPTKPRPSKFAAPTTEKKSDKESDETRQQIQRSQEQSTETHHALPQGTEQPQSDGPLGAIISPPGAPVMPARATTPQGDPWRSAMLQAGLSLMVPQWGNFLSQVGQAAGQGAGAFTRVQDANRAREREDAALQLESAKTQADIQATKALTTARQASAESSRAERIRKDKEFERGGTTKKRGTSQFERMMEELGLGAKGGLYLKEALGSIDDVTGPYRDLPVAERFNKILEDARQVDAGQTAASRPADNPVTYEIGQEIPDDEGNIYIYQGGPINDPSSYKLKTEE